MKVKEENEKVGLKLNIQKTKLMASGTITSWQIDGETMETVADLIWGAPKLLQMVTAAMKLKDACSLEEKLWPTTKVHLGNAMVLPIVMYRCENWSIKKLNTEELMLLNCGVGEDSWESLGQWRDSTSPS